MGKKDGMSRDQKRKAKLAKRKNSAPVSLAYEGNRYKTEELLPVVAETERAIYQAFVSSRRTLVDRDVQMGLEKLVLDMKAGLLQPLEETQSYKEGDQAGIVIGCIRAFWERLFKTQEHPGKQNLIGILRTLLNSIRTFGGGGPHSRGYLHFVEGFLKRGGLTSDIAQPQEVILPLTEGDSPLPRLAAPSS